MLKLISLGIAMVSMIGCAHSGEISSDRQWISVCELPKVGWTPWRSKEPRRIRAEAQGGGFHVSILLKDSACEKAAVLLTPASLSYDQAVLELRRQTTLKYNRETKELLKPRVEVEIFGSLRRQKTLPYIWGIVLHEPPILWPDGSEGAK